MFLKANRQFKDGKEHIYYTLNERIQINRVRHPAMVCAGVHARRIIIQPIITGGIIHK